MPNDVNVYLWSHETLAWLMRPGQHEILVPENLVSNEVWCSYIPIIGDASVTTIGLKWDLSMFSFLKIYFLYNLILSNQLILFHFLLQPIQSLVSVKFSAHQIHILSQM